jgi:3-methylfumaryl-CoA hydratase
VTEISLDTLQAGYKLPDTLFTPSSTQLFLYAASTWNAHRIHYDYPYATGVEGYANLVVQGPLIADFFTQHVVKWLDGRGEIRTYEYSNRAVTYLNETLVARAVVHFADPAAGRLEIVGDIQNMRGDVILPGRVTVAMKS